MWADLARRTNRLVPDASVTAVADALDYLCLAQLYLRDNLLLARPLTPADVKTRPAGHWGVCPPVNRILAALGPLQAAVPDGYELHVLHGAGHAGPSALAHAYLTGQLGHAYPHLRQDAAGLRELVVGFPRADISGEITPMIPGHLHTGGQLGPALAIGHGTVLDAPHRLSVVLIGDGECETGTTAASWLATRALHGTGDHGTVLPVILLNGMRMGGPSVLSTLSRAELTAYFTGLGHRPVYSNGLDIHQLRQAVAEALGTAQPLGIPGPSSVLVLTLGKGHGTPAHLAGTPAVHKTPLRDPAGVSAEFDALSDWLASYQPDQLLTPAGRPRPHLLPALPLPRPEPVGLSAPRGCVAASAQVAGYAVGRPFAQVVPEVLRARAEQGPFRVFSPDELASNRLDLTDENGRPVPWAVEVLSEELCHAWAQGYTETGRHALVATYEAFAPITLSLIQQQLKHRSVRRHAGLAQLPSLVYLLTSLSWHNTITHQNPSLTSALLAGGDPTLHVLTPADPARTAAALTFALRKLDRCTIVVAGKHATVHHPLETLDEELRHGIATWPHLTHPGPGEPDLTLASAGDLPAEALTTLAQRLRAERPGLRLRYVHVHDLTALAEDGTRPLALAPDAFARHFGTRAPIVLATSGHPADIHALLGHRHPGPRLTVLGYRDPGRPVSQEHLRRLCGLDEAGLWQLATTLTDPPEGDTGMSTPLPPIAPDADTLDAFERDGYAIIREAISPKLRDRLLTTAEKLLASDITQGRDRGGDGKDGFRGCLNLAPAFLPLLANTVVLPTVVQLLSPNIHLLSAHLIALPSGPPRTIRIPERHGWHRDMYGVTADLGFPHTPRMAIKAAHYLTPVTPDCGLTMFLPGSHRLTDEPVVSAGAIDPPGAVTPDITGTDTVLFENRTWHTGGINLSGHPRIALMLQYGYRWLHPVDDPATNLQRDPALTPIEQQLLGLPDRHPDRSLAKGKGAAPIRSWWETELSTSMSVRKRCSSRPCVESGS